jgi:hypothetical protein
VPSPLQSCHPDEPTFPALVSVEPYGHRADPDGVQRIG